MKPSEDLNSSSMATEMRTTSKIDDEFNEDFTNSTISHNMRAEKWKNMSDPSIISVTF